MSYVLRPASMRDAQAVVDLCNADEARFRGAATHDLESRRLFWQRAQFDLQADTRVAALPDGSLAAYAVVQDRPQEPTIQAALWLDPTVHAPEIQAKLLDWLEARARDRRFVPPAASVLAQKIASEDKARAQCLLQRGYKLVRHFMRMRIDLASCPTPPRFPAGIAVRAMCQEQDLPPLSIVCQEAFHEHWGHVPRTLEDDVVRYEQWLADDPNLDLSFWHLAFDGAEPVGACLGTAHWPGKEELAYVFTLGVRPDWRGRGIGKALLQHAFHTFYQANRRSIELDVDAENSTGALRLYTSVGMTPKWQKDLYELAL